MSGFNNAKVDQAFFPDGRFKSNFLCNIGYGDHGKLFNHNPRLDFEDACTLRLSVTEPSVRPIAAPGQRQQRDQRHQRRRPGSPRRRCGSATGGRCR